MAQDIQPTSESYHPQDVVFNTHLIQRAMEGLQKSREKFQALLEQAELGELSIPSTTWPSGIWRATA